MSAISRHNVTISGPETGRPMLFAHGFGCDQNMWRHVAPVFAEEYRVITFDHMGAGGSDLSAYDPERYATLGGYAEDVVSILDELDLHDVVFVGHSVSAMIGVLAERARPGRVGELVLGGPPPRCIDDESYRGGFSEADITELLESLESNYLGWSSAMAPVIVGNPDRPELGEELTNSFCRTDPEIAKHFARVTFLSDNRADLAAVRTPALVLQCADDAIAPEPVGAYVHERLADSRLVLMDATGHCPNLSAPAETIAAIRAFLEEMCRGDGSRPQPRRALLADSAEELYEHAPCGYFSTVLDGTIVRVNQTF